MREKSARFQITRDIWQNSDVVNFLAPCKTQTNKQIFRMRNMRNAGDVKVS